MQKDAYIGIQQNPAELIEKDYANESSKSGSFSSAGLVIYVP